jgi:hypothetical protein
MGDNETIKGQGGRRIWRVVLLVYCIVDLPFSRCTGTSVRKQICNTYSRAQA